MKNRWQRFARFNLIGLLGAVLQSVLTLSLSEWMRWSRPAAALVAVELVLLHNFAWHWLFTFGERRMSDWKDGAGALLRFHTGNGLISLAGNWAVTYWLANQFNAPVLLSTAIAIALCSVLNFFVAQRWVFPVVRVADGNAKASGEFAAAKSASAKHKGALS